jgi:hypothetical protein
MARTKLPLWWGYVDYDEKIHIKRYKGDDRPIRNAQDSGTTIGIFEPFEAVNIGAASYIILQKYRELTYHQKRDIQ